MSEPIRRKRGCCARAATSQAAVAPAPPITLMKSRRLIALPEPAPAFARLQQGNASNGMGFNGQFAQQQSRAAHVADGSFTSFPPSQSVRFAPRADIRPMLAFMRTRP